MGNGATQSALRAAATERAIQEQSAASASQKPNGQASATVDLSRLGFKPAGSDTRFCKFGFYGEQGSGKTTTASWIAREIAKREGKGRAFMIDSEGGSDYVESLFRAAGIDLQVVKSREFGRLVTLVEAMKDSGEVLLLDSVTHFWNDLVESVLKAKKSKRLEVSDWGPIFETWRLFTRPYVSSHLHFIVCMRMGYEYTTTVNPETGRLEFYKSDTKAKAGEQFGHEPSVLVHMEQIKNANTLTQLEHATDKMVRRNLAIQLQQQRSLDFVATVEKDRSRLIMARQFIFTAGESDEDNAKAVLEAFEPVVGWHLRNTSHSGFEPATGATDGLVPSEADTREYLRKKARKEIVLGEITATFTRWFPSTSPIDRQAAVIVCEKVFGVRGWESISVLPLETLEAVITPQPDGPSVLEQTCIAEREIADGKKTAGAKKPASVEA